MRILGFAFGLALVVPGCITDPSLFIDLRGNGAGTVVSDPEGIDCGRACAMIVNENNSVTLTATPRTGSIFEGWRGGGCTGTDPCTTTLSVDTTVEATFTVSP